MKQLTEYIIEGTKNFTLNDSERDALASFIGTLSGNLGEDEEIQSLDVIRKGLTPDEINQLDDLYDFLDNTETYKKVNRSNLKDEISLIQKIYNLATIANVLDEQWDLIDALEKICL